MLKKFVIICFLFLIPFLSHAQDEKGNIQHIYLGRWLITVEGGLILGFTDYEQIKPSGALRGGFEYYFSSNSRNIIGIKLYGGGGKITGEDSRTQLQADDGLQNIISPFITDIYVLGFAGTYFYSIANKFFPYVQIGLSNIWFSPKDENGKKLEGNSQNLYKKTSLVYDFDFGTKIQLNKLLSLNFSTGYHINNTDYLDDISAGGKNDNYFSFLIGISVFPFQPEDRDGDGILDEFDPCPDDAEDFDGVEDADGCPDYDNDHDGIPDINDLCPNQAEDIDGFADTDGCPDPDNDLDGIPDQNDKCPNEAEDVDGFLDQDGCPDYDNDNDGIADSVDQCPNKPETKNGYEDEDGCPDQLKVVSVDEMRYYGNELFYENSSTIKPEGIPYLLEAFETLKSEPNSKWRIEGHMDSRGSEQSIRQMSYNRAEAIYEFFIAKGISPNRLTVYGMSDDFPIADNTSPEGRMKNRRIEIVREK